jgi:hypothetical protein
MKPFENGTHDVLNAVVEATKGGALSIAGKRFNESISFFHLALYI